jgi:hypothetical protein
MFKEYFETKPIRKIGLMCCRHMCMRIVQGWQEIYVT